ncbi:hypothetical protein JXJ21_15210 [candidate division KSB1 bacterium]|nr:hypothetical protein [candidate division KSB1 bacterium]
MTFRLYFILIALMLICTCSTKTDWQGVYETREGVEIIRNPEIGIWNDSKEWVLTPEIALGEGQPRNEQTKISSILDVDGDSAGNIYLCDYKANNVKIFDQDGCLQTVIAHGKNRTETLDGPILVAVNGKGYLAVYESNRDQISLFARSGKFIQSFNTIWHDLQSIEMDDSSQLYLSALNLKYNNDDTQNDETECCIRKYNFNGKIISEFSKPFLIRDQHNLVNPHSTVLLRLLQDGNLVCALHFPYILRIYEVNGKLKRIISKEFANENMVSTVRISQLPFECYMLMTQYNILDTFELPDGKLVVHFIDKDSSHVEKYKSVLKARLTNAGDNSIFHATKHHYDLFDEKGYFLQAFTLDSGTIGIIKYIDSKGRLYIQTKAADSGEHRLIRYRYSFEPKRAAALATKPI